MHAPIGRQTLRFSLAVLLLLISPVCAVSGAQDDPERARAFRLFDDANYHEALPAFEKLAAKYPEDREVIKNYGLLLIMQAPSIKDEAARKEARRRGRETLLKAQKLGADGTLLRWMLESTPADGSDGPPFSSKKEAEEAMRAGEDAFGKKEYAKALESYQLALFLDPKLYEAALFAGDVFFVTAEQKKAGEWFARAVAINPDRETAYRYWGDSLMKQGRVTEAGDKFIEAYLAEPYSRLSRAAFLNWGKRVNIYLNHPQVDIPDISSQQPGQVTITLPNRNKDDKGNAGAAWVMYSLVRGGWGAANFAKEYPNEKKYRHSLKEEADALRAAIKAYQGKQGKNSQNTDAGLELLSKLDKEGLLESFILLALPDEGIVQDYVAYRRTHLEHLRRYVKQYVLTDGGKQ